MSAAATQHPTPRQAQEAQRQRAQDALRNLLARRHAVAQQRRFSAAPLTDLGSFR